MLLGAAKSIKRFHPKLAICIYHRGYIDHYEVPKTILSIRQDYEFYVEAYKDNLNETVLFALPVDHIPERRAITSKIALAIKEMYISVHNKLCSTYREDFFNEFRLFLDQYSKYRFEWTFYGDNAKLFLSVNQQIYYKLHFLNSKISVQLVLGGFEAYHDVCKNKITETLNHFLETHMGYLHSNKNGVTSIYKNLALSATSESAACNMAVLINETVEELWHAGIIDPEYAVTLLKEFR